MSDAKERRAAREETSGMRELLGIRARLVGDELIDEHGRVIAVANRRAFRAWLRSDSTFSSCSSNALLLQQDE
jgi:hypothetical protein